MGMCENCYFKGHESADKIYCKLSSSMVTFQTECSYFMPSNLLCPICKTNPVNWLVFLDSGEEDFICDLCESEVRYNIQYVALKMSEVPLGKIREVYVKKEKRKMNKRLLQGRIDSLSEKERKAYEIIAAFKGGILIKSLNKQDRGCLGNIVRKDLCKILSVTLNYRSFKLVKLNEE